MSFKLLKSIMVFLIVLSFTCFSIQTVYGKSLKKLDFLLSDILRCGNFSFMSSEFKDKEKLKKYRDDFLQKNYEENPEVFSAAIEYGLALIDLSEADKALKVFEKAEKDFIANPVPRVYKGWAEACSGDYLNAKNSFYPIVKELHGYITKGQDFPVWFPYQIDAILGLALVKDKLDESNQKDIEQVVSTVIDKFGLNSKLISILIINNLREGKIKEAEEKINFVLTKNPDDSLQLTLLGITKGLEGKHKEAIEKFDKVEKLHSNSALNHFFKARSLFELKKQKEALEEIEKAIALDPDWEAAKEERNKLLAKNTAKKWFLNYK